MDYRRLVFISSDSSSGREEDDADSSCSSSSYLNGLPRSNGGHHHHHAQSLEDCDWDYFESGSLPLPAIAIGAGNVGADVHGVAQDWSCCPGRGSAACQVYIYIYIHAKLEISSLEFSYRTRNFLASRVSNGIAIHANL